MKGVTLVIIAIVAVVAILFILGGYFLYSSLSDGDVSDGDDGSNSASMVEVEEKINEAISNNDVSVCDELNPAQSEECVNNFNGQKFDEAIEESDSSICDSIQDEAEKQSCKESIEKPKAPFAQGGQ